ncbi:MAG: hypothetical protein FWD60_03540 [Candidatus Azobacteroides sp.]|nr:hypothetical protein [Candidatus Azobacteroides sp.]
MKKYIIIINLLLGINCWAQTYNKSDFPKEEFLSKFGVYFEDIELNETGTILLKAKENSSIIKDTYSSLTEKDKTSVIESVMSKAHCSLAIIEYKYERELWGKDANSNTVTLLDKWDLNTLYTPKPTLKTLKTTDAHPFFQYYGLNGSFSADQTNLYYSSHYGFFLLKDRWDFAFTYGIGVSGNGESSSSNYNAGLMSKVYFPMRKYNIAPYAGLGISYAVTYDENGNLTNSLWNVPLYLGISWYVGTGSLDLGLQISENTAFMVGYTFSPSKSSRNKINGQGAVTHKNKNVVNSYSRPVTPPSSVPAHKNETIDEGLRKDDVLSDVKIDKNQGQDVVKKGDTIVTVTNQSLLPQQTSISEELKPATIQPQKTTDNDNAGIYDKRSVYAGHQKIAFTETILLVSTSGERFEAQSGDTFEGEMKEGKIVQGKVIRNGKTVKLFLNKSNF